MSPPKRVPCEICEKSLANTPSNVSQHMRKQHGVFKRKARNGTGPNIQGFHQMEGFVLLEDDKGGLWLAEQIK